ncbi:hypothetical protein TWF106_002675 [Orbilia oligospora]|uniref:Uncharacterized protein n=1 Tax=Orbilia oligospora TaxID=2813651 RepID=A0A7C8U9P5_ORBOL|nr:hypothetical protein TWF106_002675 [Orbilia oligospora]
MVNWIFTEALAVTTIFSFTAEANPHRYRHHHLRRATATTPSCTLIYSGVKRVPDFDDCIDFITLESSGTYSTVAKECASTADVPTTGAKFFAVYQTDDQKGTNFWWCGWWETAISDMADVIESHQEDGDAIYKAYGYNFTPLGSTSSSASTKGSTSTPASVKRTASTSSKAASSISSSVKGATSTSVSTTTPVVNTSKSDSSTSAVKKSLSTLGTDAKPSSTSLKTTSTSSTINASISSAGSSSSSGNVSPSSASFLTSGSPSSSFQYGHTGKTKLKTSSSSSTSSSTGTVSAIPNVGSDLPATPTTLAKKASSAGSSSSSTGNTPASIKKVSSSAGNIPSTTTYATTISKAGTSPSGPQAPGKLSTQIAPTGVTTVTYVATATGIAGFSFVTGAINAVPSQNIINY